jgi:hypothetical protein
LPTASELDAGLLFNSVIFVINRDTFAGGVHAAVTGILLWHEIGSASVVLTDVAAVVVVVVVVACLAIGKPFRAVAAQWLVIQAITASFAVR